MSSLMTIKLNKAPGTSWGFRLQGGKDFATPLCVQKVNGGSVAEKSGLQAGDAIVSIAGKDAISLRHKDAQDLIVFSGNNFDLVVQRGMQTWRPAVSVLPEVKQLPDGMPVVTKTSLAATPQDYRPIGSSHNTAAKPFGVVGQKQIVNAPYNSPINLYSEDSIAETLSAQAEVLGKGVIGINFKKYEREAKIRTDSPTYKLLHGEEDEPSPRKPRPPPVQRESGSYLPFQHDPTEQQGAQPVRQEEGYTPAAGGAQVGGGLQPGENVCAVCQRLIVGVFVRIKNKNLHAECFKCATCGASLKNVGYYNINEKLYCDMHAKQAARHNPPGPNVVPITVPPGGVRPTGAMSSPEVRSMKVPFHPKVPAAAHPPAPAPVPAPTIIPPPIFQEPQVAPQAPMPEPILPEPIPEPQPIHEEVEEVFAPPVVESEPQLQAEPSHAADITSDEKPHSKETKEPAAVVSEPRFEFHEPELNNKPLEDEVFEETEHNDIQPQESLKHPSAEEQYVQPKEEPSRPDQIQEGEHKTLPDEYAQPHEQELISDIPLKDVQEEVALADGYPAEAAITSDHEFKGEDSQVPKESIFDDISANLNGPSEGVISEVNGYGAPVVISSLPSKSVGIGVQSFESHQVSSSYTKVQSEESHFFESKSSFVMPSDPSEILRAPAVPAPSFTHAPAPVPKMTPAAPTSVGGPSLQRSHANPMGFGAPIGDIDVRSHIPKKGERFEWPPRRMVQEEDEESHPPAWAPAGGIPSVPKPVKPTGPPPKKPPLLPTPPPPKDYDVIVMKAAPPTPSQSVSETKPRSLSMPQPAPALAKPLVSQPTALAPYPPSRFPNPAPSFILATSASAVPQPATPQSTVVPTTSTASPKPSTFTTVPIAPTKRCVISPPKLIPVTEPMPSVRFESIPLKLSESKIQPPLSKLSPSSIIQPLATKTQLIPGFKTVSAPTHSAHVPPVTAFVAPPLPPTPVVSSLPASAPALAKNVDPKPVPSNPSALADVAPAPVPAQIPLMAPISSFGSDSMPKPTPPPIVGGGLKFGRGVPQTPGRRVPRRGRGVINPASASRIPICASCQRQIRGPFVTALGKTWCPDHFICATDTCRKPILEMGFVEEQGSLYCEFCYESYLAPICGKCDKRIKGDCLNAVGKQFHPECFCCAYCGKVFGSGAFYLEDGLPYCETDWNDLFTTKCVGCSFPIEAGDRWVEALNNNYHSQCFKCSKCHKNLEGQSFFAKGGKPFCKAHAQRGF